MLSTAGTEGRVEMNEALLVGIRVFAVIVGGAGTERTGIGRVKGGFMEESW